MAVLRMMPRRPPARAPSPGNSYAAERREEAIAVSLIVPRQQKPLTLWSWAANDESVTSAFAPPVSTPAQRGRRSPALATIVLEHQALARLPRVTTNTRANRPV